MPAPIASTTGAEHTAILGLGVYRPSRVVTNDEVAGPINSSDEWIRTRSGIRTRRFAGPDETVISMSTDASREALAAAGIEPDQIDCVVLATSTHLLLTPAAAPQVATALGMSETAAFDVSAGCAGFCHALTLASDMVKSGTARHVLVVGVEKLTDTLDFTDRTTAFIFGDGAWSWARPRSTASVRPSGDRTESSGRPSVRPRTGWNSSPRSTRRAPTQSART